MSIPNDVWKAIQGDAPVLYSYNDQWFEDGYVYTNGKVYSYSIDRKDQTDRLHWSRSVEEFLSSASQKEKAWLEEVL